MTLSTELLRRSLILLLFFFTSCSKSVKSFGGYIADPKLNQAIKDANSNDNAVAANALFSLRGGNSESLRAYFYMLDSKNSNIRARACSEMIATYRTVSVNNSAPDKQALLQAYRDSLLEAFLITAKQDKELFVRKTAIQAFKFLVELDLAQAEQLLVSTQKENTGSIETDNPVNIKSRYQTKFIKKIINNLIDLVVDKDPQIQRESALASINFAGFIEKPIIREINTKHATKYIIAVLTKVNYKDSVKEIGKFLKSEDWEVRAQAALSLGDFGSASEDFVPELITLLSDPNEAIQKIAAVSLVKIGRADGVEAVIKKFPDSELIPEMNMDDPLADEKLAESDI